MKVPSNKVSVALLVCVLVVTSIIVYNNQQDKNSTEINREVDLVVERSPDTKAGDRDGDRLFDWQETLWGTDPNNPDTDGDGTPDGEEVQNNRDPKKAGPDDQIVSENSILSNYEPGETDENSLTSQVARNLFTNFANFQKSGSIDTEIKKTLATSISEGAENQVNLNLDEKYSASILNTFDARNPVKLKEYANKMIEIQLEELEKVAQNSESTEDLGYTIYAYSTISSRLSVIPVPDALAGTHAKIINNFYQFSVVLDNLNKYDEDPVLALLSIRKYNEIAEEQPILYAQITEYLKENDIIFSEEEPGIIFYEPYE